MAGIYTITTHNLQAQRVLVESHMSNGLPGTTVVGLPSKSVTESKVRLRAAFAASRFQWPRKRLVINLAPADVPKRGSGLDLAIAVSVLQVINLLPAFPHDAAFIGELGLEGQIQPVRGIIGLILAGRSEGVSTFYIPAANLMQARLVPGVVLYPVASLVDLVAHCQRLVSLTALHTGKGQLAVKDSEATSYPDLANIRGHAVPKRALEIAAAGGHHLLMTGPPGGGKSLLSQALAGILPPPTQEEVLEITQLHSLVSQSFDEVLTRRPFRSLHHTTSLGALLGTTHHPGEISLAHHGVLFLDELSEFQRPILEALRQPLEDHCINRFGQLVPAKFSLVASTNPCPCGYFGQSNRCRCSPVDLRRHSHKLSGPLIDRIDLYVDVTPVDHQLLLSELPMSDTSGLVRQRVTNARSRQADRLNGMLPNAQASPGQLSKTAGVTTAAIGLLDQAAHQFQLSSRGYLRTMAVARTIADLDQHVKVGLEHIAEALQFRPKQTTGESP